MSNVQRDVTVEAPVKIAVLDRISGGDSDVFSKKNRHTIVTVVTLQPVVPPDATSVFVTVVYEVMEGAKNFTHLRGEQTIKFPIESGARLIKIGPGGRDANYRHIFEGEDHNTHDVSNSDGIVGTYLKNCNIKFDDKGDDDHGNAHLDGILQLPVTVEIEGGDRPNSPFGTHEVFEKFPLNHL